MNRCIFLLQFGILGLVVTSPTLAAETERTNLNVITDIPSLKEINLPATSAQLLTPQPEAPPTEENAPAPDAVEAAPVDAEVDDTDNTTDNEADISVDVTGEQDIAPESTPTYVIEKEEIDKQGADSVAEILKNAPGFAVNDAGFGADIHTGTFYRGHSINQSVFLLNGRPIGSNVSTYHGATDLNTLPAEAIERVELSSGTSSTLYGSDAFGGVVNIITKEGNNIPKANGLVEFGSYNESNYRASYGGAFGGVRYNLGYERYNADNDYKVPVGAANRDARGRLFNGDVATSNYFGSLGFDLDKNNSLSLDGYVISSRKGLIYFGFPLQRDRLNHDVVNVGLNWRSKLSGDDTSVLNATVGYNQDYFDTFGPTQNVFFRQGSLNSRAITARLQHDWQFNPSNTLRWGFDVKNSYLDGDVFSTLPRLTRFNGEENRDRFESAIFALNTFKFGDNFNLDLGLRQNFTSEFGSYLNPSLGLRYAFNPLVAVRGSWVSVQRNPGLDQLYVFDTVHNWLPNPNLEPETGSSWTAGVDVNVSENISGQFTYFGSSLDNRLAVISGRWNNIGLVNTNGLEAALRWKVTPQWSTFLNYTYTDAKIESGVEKGLQLSMIPYSVGKLGIGYESNGWQVNLFTSYYSGARRAFFNNPGESTRDFTPSWLNFDLGLRVPITRNLGINVFVENLADVQYERVNRTYSPGRTIGIGLSSSL